MTPSIRACPPTRSSASGVAEAGGDIGSGAMVWALCACQRSRSGRNRGPEPGALRGSRVGWESPGLPGLAWGSLGARRLLVAALEPLDAAGGVDELLLAGEEGMASAADLQPQLGLRRVGLEGVTAGADHGHPVHLGMDVFLHGSPSFFLIDVGGAPRAQEPGRLAD